MNGFAAAVELLRRAQRQGCFVEAICLSTSVIDSSLRIGLVLNYQLKCRTQEVPEKYVHESNKGKKTLEREIYSMCLNEKIIKRNLFDKLNTLYTKRNQVVHRYVLSEITTEQVVLLAKEYDDIIDEVGKCVRQLEDEQIIKGIGMTKTGADVPGRLKGKGKEMVRNLARIKHGNHYLASKLR